MKLVPFLATTALVAAVPVHAAEPLEVRSTVLVEARRHALDGSTRVVLTAPAKVVPGDRIVYVLAYRNTGNMPLASVVLADPLPAGVVYRAPADGSPAPELSVDGETYGTLAELRVAAADGTSRPATAEDVRHVRWRLTSPIAAGGRGQVAFAALLK